MADNVITAGEFWSKDGFDRMQYIEGLDEAGKEKHFEVLSNNMKIDFPFLRSSLKLNAAEHGGGVSFLVVIEYDAQNSFGASLRDTSLCSHDSYGGEFGEYDDEDDVLIDGQKYLDWLRYN